MTLRTAGLAAVAMTAFAANSLLCRAALGAGAVDALTFTTVRLVSGALVLALLARGRARGGVAGWRLGGALFFYAVGFSLAYTRITAAVGALLLFGAVQVTMIGAGLVAGERPLLREWLGLALALGGLVGLTFPGLAAPDPIGAAFMLAAGVGWGTYSLGARSSGEPLVANAASFACSVPLALVAQAVGFWTMPPRVTATGLALAVVSGAVTSGLGYAIWYAAVRGLTAAQAAIVQLSVPPLAALGAVALLGETLGLRLIVSGVAVLGGIAVAFAARRR